MNIGSKETDKIDWKVKRMVLTSWLFPQQPHGKEKYGNYLSRGTN